MLGLKSVLTQATVNSLEMQSTTRQRDKGKSYLFSSSHAETVWRAVQGAVRHLPEVSWELQNPPHDPVQDKRCQKWHDTTELTFHRASNPLIILLIQETSHSHSFLTGTGPRWMSIRCGSSHCDTFYNLFWKPFLTAVADPHISLFHTPLWALVRFHVPKAMTSWGILSQIVAFCWVNWLNKISWVPLHPWNLASYEIPFL